MAATSEDVSKATDAETCGQAFDLTKNDWNFNYSNRHWVAEATKRKLDVADCLSLLGKSSDSLSNLELCGLALDPAQRNWDLSYSHRLWIAEVEKRHLSISDCRDLIGVTVPDVSRASNEELCKHALNKNGDDWNTEFQNKFWLEEVRKRSLSVKDCAALLVARGVEPVGANRSSEATNTEFRFTTQTAIAGSCYAQNRPDKSFAKYSDDDVSDFCTCFAKKFLDSFSEAQLATFSGYDEQQWKQWVSKAKNAAHLTRAAQSCMHQHLNASPVKPATPTLKEKKKRKKKT
jgi:hypothetical protein